MPKAKSVLRASQVFSEGCTNCARLSGFLSEVRLAHPNYFARPVPPFGDTQPRLLIVGLAPGMHGANRTGRPFTGDFAGVLLYETLFKFGYSNRLGSAEANDGLQLHGCRITNAVKCLPPQNKPTPDEISICNNYLSDEINVLHKSLSILALGQIAHKAVLMARGLKASAFTFAHAAQHDLGEGITLFDSYHCSRYNTQTRRLTPEMFHAVFARIRAHEQGT